MWMDWTKSWTHLQISYHFVSFRIISSKVTSPLSQVRSAGIEAGAVRGLQALRATLLTAVEAANSGELQEAWSGQSGWERQNMAKPNNRVFVFFFSKNSCVWSTFLETWLPEAVQTIQRLANGERVDDAPLARLLRKLFQKRWAWQNVETWKHLETKKRKKTCLSGSCSKWKEIVSFFCSRKCHKAVLIVWSNEVGKHLCQAWTVHSVLASTEITDVAPKQQKIHMIPLCSDQATRCLGSVISGCKFSWQATWCLTLLDMTVQGVRYWQWQWHFLCLSCHFAVGLLRHCFLQLMSVSFSAFPKDVRDW